jgi:hypothetical protein
MNLAYVSLNSIEKCTGEGQHGKRLLSEKIPLFSTRCVLEELNESQIMCPQYRPFVKNLLEENIIKGFVYVQVHHHPSYGIWELRLRLVGGRTFLLHL